MTSNVAKSKIAGSSGVESYDSVVRHLQEYIAGTKQKADRSEETIFFKGKLDAAFRLILDMGLKTAVLDHDYALSSLVKNISGQLSIYPIAIALRRGCNPNLYIEDKMVSPNPIHILAYTYYSWGRNVPEADTRYLTSIILLLVYYGSSPLRPAIGLGNRPYIEGVTETGLNVIEWLEDNRYRHILRIAYPNYKANLDKDTLQLLVVMTGDVTIIDDVGTPDLIPEKRVQTIMFCRTDDPSFGLLNMAKPPRMRNGMDYQVVYWAMENMCSDAYAHYASMGLGISYPLLNTAILRLKAYTRNGNVLLRDAYIEMIESSIRTGTPLDTDQRLLLGEANATIQDRLVRIYQRPYWEKVCNRQSSIGGFPLQLQGIASEMGIEPNDDRVTVCTQLHTISGMDKQVARDSIVNRQKARLSAKHGTVEEFSTGDIPVLTCTKLTAADGDYMEYPDLYVASYRDSKKRVWCFPSYNYHIMMERKVNPVDGTRLPESFLSEVRSKDSEITRLALSEKKVDKIDDLLDNLNKPDIYYDGKSEEQVKRFYAELDKMRITPDEIKTITPAILDKAVRAGEYNGNLNLLPREHAIVTTAYIVNYYRVNEPGRADTILQQLSESIYWKREEDLTTLYQRQM